MSSKAKLLETTKPSKSNTHRSPVKNVTRKIKPAVQLLIYVRAGGRCEFDGCPRYLVEHHLTHKPGNFAQMAHVVAFSKKGPRGDVTDRPEDINNIDNLMLLCHQCHKLIDDNPDEHSREQLEGFKRTHEERIFRLTGMSPDRQTTIVMLKSKIGGQMVKISQGEINDAISPRYAASPSGREIDLTTIQDEGPAFYELGAKMITQTLDQVIETVMGTEGTNHLSVFALGPMPLLILAGSKLGDKVPCELYQRHRDTQDWTWKKGGKAVRYQFETIRKGSNRKTVALVLSLSGKIDLDHLPDAVKNEATIYEMTLDGVAPNTGFLRSRQDLKNFRDAYQRALREIGAAHGKLDELHLFPAVPAPVAVAVGRELMPKIDPTVIVYDDDHRHGGFKKIIEVNTK
jgi:hypothetical protein